MLRDDPITSNPRLPASTVAPGRRSVLVPVVTGLVVVAAICSLTAAAFHYWHTPAPDAGGNGGGAPQPAQEYFRNWPKQDLVLVLSGQMHGYMLPCGCSEPQYGGLERRYNFIQGLKDRGWPVLAYDVGDLNQRKGPAGLPNVQGLLKYVFSMEALSLMPMKYDHLTAVDPKDQRDKNPAGYSAIALGECEGVLPVERGLGEWSLNNPSPRVLAGNLIKRTENFPDQAYDVQVVRANASPLKIGVTAVTGPAVVENITTNIRDPKLTFAGVKDTLPALLKEMDKHKPDLRVLLYQGTLKEAKACATAFQQFQVVLCLSEEDEPPSQPDKVGSTLVVRVGHKGKHLGVVGIKSTGKKEPAYELRYEMITLGPELATPNEKVKDQPIINLMERYTRKLKDDNYLAKYGQSNHPLQVAPPGGAMPAYVGSQKCKGCHESAYKIWEKTPHSHAYVTLVDPERKRRPGNRQFDGECIVCHTVGFSYKTGFENAEKTPLLKDVGCESCHGPCSQHVKQPNNAQWRELINPWKAKVDPEPEEAKKARMKRIERDVCIHCHDQDNDVHWNFKKWIDGKIIHMNPKD